MGSIHDWTVEQRRELFAQLDGQVAEMATDDFLQKYLGEVITAAKLPDTADIRKAVLLGAVLSSIGSDDT